MTAPTLVFDIETVPDVETGRRLLDLDGLPDEDVAAAMSALRRQERGNDFLPPHLHRIVAVSVAFRDDSSFRVWSLGEEGSGEGELVQRFFDGVERYQPQLVSWNGGAFDLPVLQYRALRHGVPAPCYWDTGGRDRDCRFNNYLNRYHERHFDVMDFLSMFQARAAAPLHDVAVLLGLPGKLGMDGSQVFGAWRAGRIAEIRGYCETDVLNTYLIFLRLQLLRGSLDAGQHERELGRARQFIEGSGAAHWREYAQAWR